MPEPMEMTIPVDAFDKSLDDWLERVNRGTEAGLADAGREVGDEARHSFGTADGPQSRTGTLEHSIIVDDVTKVGDSGYEVRIGPSGVEYARKIELGGFPYLEPGLGRASDRILTAMRAAWQAAQKG